MMKHVAWYTAIATDCRAASFITLFMYLLKEGILKAGEMYKKAIEKIKGSLLSAFRMCVSLIQWR